MVAIIAILVAIAIPIYTNSLASARIAVHEANARVIKNMAVTELLSPSQDTITNLTQATLTEILETVSGGTNVYATGTVEADGTITLTGLTATADDLGGKITGNLGAVVPTGGSADTDGKDVSDAGAIDVHQDLTYTVVIDATVIDVN